MVSTTFERNTAKIRPDGLAVNVYFFYGQSFLATAKFEESGREKGQMATLANSIDIVEIAG